MWSPETLKAFKECGQDGVEKAHGSASTVCAKYLSLVVTVPAPVTAAGVFSTPQFLCHLTGTSLICAPHFARLSPLPRPVRFKIRDSDCRNNASVVGATCFGY